MTRKGRGARARQSSAPEASRTHMYIGGIMLIEEGQTWETKDESEIKIRIIDVDEGFIYFREILPQEVEGQENLDCCDFLTEDEFTDIYRKAKD
jgi:hypothetical protein